MIESISYEQAQTKMPQAVNCLDYFRKMFLANLPDEVKKDTWIAGGAVKDWLEKGYVSKDVDFFFNNRESAAKVTWHLRRKYQFKLYFATKNAIKGYCMVNNKRINVDIVKHNFQNALECIENFDFTICCFGCSADNFYYHTTGAFDLLKKKIVINKVQHPVDTMRRLIKYIRKGYYTCNGTIMTISKEIAGLNPDDVSIFEFYKFD